MKNVSNALKNILPIVVILAAISPFVIIDRLFFPYITGKAFYFRTIVEIGVLLYAILITINKSYRPKITPLTLAVTAFVVILGLATIFAVDPLKAFWSNFERMEGLVLFLHLIAFYFIAFAVMKKENGWWNWFFNVSLVMSVVVGIDAFITFYSDPSHTGYRIFGRLGNSSYLGVYSLIHIFISLFYIVKKIGHRSVKALANQGSFVSITLYGLIGLFNLIVLLNTGTRGSFVGLVLGIGLAAVLIAIFEKKQRALRNTGIILIATAIAFVAILGIFKESAFIKNSDMLRRFSALVTFDVKSVLDNEGNARKMLWGMAFEGFKERPVLGWGLDNFNYVFSAKYNPAMYGQEQWFDRSHNVFTDWLTSAGILGLVSYLSLFACALFMLWKIRVEKMPYALKAIVTGGFAAYLGHNLFVFDNLSSYIMFFSVLAWITSLYIADKHEIAEEHHKHPHEKQKHEVEWNSMKPAIVASVAILGIVAFGYVCYTVNIKPMMANADIINSIRSQVLDPKTSKVVPVSPEQKVAIIQNVVSNPVMTNSEPVEQLVDRTLEVVTSNVVANEAKSAAYQFLVKTYEDTFKRTPLDPRPYYFYATFLGRAGLLEQTLVPIQKAIELSPKKQSFYTLKATIELQLRKTAEMLKTAETSYNLETRNGEARSFYAAALIFNNRTAEAEALPKTLEEQVEYYKNNMILSAYLETKQAAKAVEKLRQLIATLIASREVDPKSQGAIVSENEIALRTALISLEIKVPAIAAAIKDLKELRPLAPGLTAQIDATIAELEAQQ